MQFLLWKDLEDLLREMPGMWEVFSIDACDNGKLAWCRPTPDANSESKFRGLRLCYFNAGGNATPVVECSMKLRVKLALYADEFFIKAGVVSKTNLHEAGIAKKLLEAVLERESKKHAVLHREPDQRGLDGGQPGIAGEHRGGPWVDH